MSKFDMIIDGGRRKHSFGSTLVEFTYGPYSFFYDLFWTEFKAIEQNSRKHD